MEADRPLISEILLQTGHKSVQGIGAVGGASRTSTEHESDDNPDLEPEPDDRGHESSSSSRKETPIKIPAVNYPMASRRPKKRREERTESDKEEMSSKLNEIVDVMKESASIYIVDFARVFHYYSVLLLPWYSNLPIYIWVLG